MRGINGGMFLMFGIMILIGCCNIFLSHRFLAEDASVIGHHTGLDPNNKRGATIEIKADIVQKVEPSISIQMTKQKQQLEQKQEQKQEKPEQVQVQVDGVDVPHGTAGLSCTDHGGPANDVAEEMIFWSDIPEDSDYKSPFYDEEKYISFEPDGGGWNNIRMAYETILVLAHATGRTLVLPPEKRMYLLGKGGGDHKKEFSFNDFFHLDSIAMEHEGMNIITMEEFLKRKGVTGQLKNLQNGQVVKPPSSKTNWNGDDLNPLWSYLRVVGKYPQGWNPSDCFAAIPASSDPAHVVELQTMFDDIMAGKHGKVPDPNKDFVDAPAAVDGPTLDRMREMVAERSSICIYDSELQQETLLHFKVDHKEKARMLTHFYAFVFFQDWKQDLWSKRFVRDHIRYVDEIVCAAARIVEAVRKRAKAHSAENTQGEYDSFHVRRGDFQYEGVKIDADKLHAESKDVLAAGPGSYGSLYIATDERKKEFFNIFKDNYDVTFLDDYMHLIKGVNPNYYGMLDQLVAYKGRIFYGTWFSTLSGYVNRMRGYYSAKEKLDGYELGHVQSWYFTPKAKKAQMTKYFPVKKPIYMREFPVSWRDIDKGIGEL